MISFKALIGHRLSIVRFYGNTLGLHFGETRQRARGDTVGEFVLHVGSPWRIDTSSKTVTGNLDHWEYGGAGERPATWTSHSGSTLLEKKLGELFGHPDQSGSWINETDRYIIIAADITGLGDLVLEFSSKITFRVFPSASEVEAWRFFAPGDETSHLTFPSNLR